MRIFVAVSLCVLAALTFPTNGDARFRSPGADGLARANDGSQPASSGDEIESDTSQWCCYIADIEMFLPILFNGTEVLKREATALIAHITGGCKGEPDSISNAPTTYGELRKAFNVSDVVDILQDLRVLEQKVNLVSCNVGDYVHLLPMLLNGTDDEKVAVFDLMMISIERCNAEFRPGDKENRHCDLDKKEKWRLFFQWMVNRYMDRVVSGKKRISAQQLL